MPTINATATKLHVELIRIPNYDLATKISGLHDAPRLRFPCTSEEAEASCHLSFLGETLFLQQRQQQQHA